MNAIPWSTLGPAGLLALTVLLIIRGDLIPRKQYDAMTEDRDFWRNLANEKDETIKELHEIARIGGKVMEAIPKAAGVEVKTEDDVT